MHTQSSRDNFHPHLQASRPPAAVGYIMQPGNVRKNTILQIVVFPSHRKCIKLGKVINKPCLVINTWLKSIGSIVWDKLLVLCINAKWWTDKLSTCQLLKSSGRKAPGLLLPDWARGIETRLAGQLSLIRGDVFRKLEGGVTVGSSLIIRPGSQTKIGLLSWTWHRATNTSLQPGTPAYTRNVPRSYR